jgi:RimJ/RimL family protein N-acetyltransferase
MVETHRDALLVAAQEPEIVRFMAFGPGRTSQAMGIYIAEILARQGAGTDLAFTITTGPEERPVGATRYIHIDRENDSVEIGGTWLDRVLWRTPFNTESKYLLFRHAFETGAVHRVWIQTDLRNERSRRAIARLGATREGVLRGDRVVGNGYHRSSVVYSVLSDEWPSVRRKLEEYLARPWPPGTAAHR